MPSSVNSFPSLCLTGEDLKLDMFHKKTVKEQRERGGLAQIPISLFLIQSNCSITLRAPYPAPSWEIRACSWKLLYIDFLFFSFK